jgi:NADH dehydrogenase
VRRLRGQKALPPFKYLDKGSLAVIGRASAVASVFGVHLAGLPAWLIWALIHLMYIVQFQSRVVVFIKWAIQDLTFNRGSRLITGDAPSDFNFDREIARETTALPASKVTASGR